MNKSMSQRQPPPAKRLYHTAYASRQSRKHLQPMYTSVWLALIQGLMNSHGPDKTGRVTPPA